MLNPACFPVRVAILDDHAVVRVGLAATLSQEWDLRVVGGFADSRSMLNALPDLHVDVLLTDYSLGPDEIDGVALVRAVRTKFPACKVLVVSSHDQPAIVALSLRAGAHGYVTKSQAINSVAKAVRIVAAGMRYLDDYMAYELELAATEPTDDVNGHLPGAHAVLNCPDLSVREREVMRCFLNGMSVTQIAEKFKRSTKTISTQKAGAYRKLGVGSDAAFFKLKHLAHREDKTERGSLGWQDGVGCNAFTDLDTERHDEGPKS